jgi:hypothetical protein
VHPADPGVEQQTPAGGYGHLLPPSEGGRPVIAGSQGRRRWHSGIPDPGGAAVLASGIWAPASRLNNAEVISVQC